MRAVLPKLKMALGASWKPVSLDPATLTWRHPAYSGDLQTSCQDPSISPRERVRRLEKHWGPASDPSEAACAYGRCLHWRHRHPGCEDARAWLLLGDDVPVLFSWLGQRNPDVERLVRGARPAPPVAISEVQPLFELAATLLAEGSDLAPAVFPQGVGEAVMTLLPDRGAGSFLVREDTIRLKPTAVGVLFDAFCHDGELRVFVHWETPTAKDMFSAVVLDGPTLGPIARADFQPYGAAHDFFDGGA